MPHPGPDLYSFEALWRHYRHCRQHKRNTLNALAFESDAEAKLLQLQSDLRAHTYRPGRSICFVTDGPKPREVFAADFRDRVVHHLLVSQQERIFEPLFIHDSFACRRGKGSLAASDRVMTFLRRVTCNGRRPAWSIKLDVASFFPSIHKPTLNAILMRRVGHPELRWLTETLLLHDPTTDYRFRSLHGGPGPESPGYPVPPHKSLFGRANQRGLAIGNLTSQFWANVYLNELDQFVKHDLRCRYYARYVDDMILVSERPQQLVSWRDAIADYLGGVLRLDLRAEPALPRPLREGVDFVGWRTWPTHRVPGRKTLVALQERVAAFERASVRRAFGGLGLRVAVSARRPPPPRRPSAATLVAEVPQLCAILAAYSAHLRHGAAWKVWTAIRERHGWLQRIFRISDWRVGERWKAPSHDATMPFRVAYGRLVRAARGDTLLFVRIGRYVEFYGPQRLAAQRVLGLRAVAKPRFGYALTSGFPAALGAPLAQRALRRGIAVARIERGRDRIELLLPTKRYWVTLIL